jgi:hypothetical protein
MAAAKSAAVTTTAVATAERHRAGGHRRRADRKGSGERKNLTPHRSLSFFLLAVAPIAFAQCSNGAAVAGARPPTTK